MIDNQVAREITWVWKWFDCIKCGGKKTVLMNPHNLDDDREITCPACDGEGGHEIQTET